MGAKYFTGPKGSKFTKYDVFEGTLNAATTTAVVFSNVTSGLKYIIKNDSNITLKYTLNGSSNPNISLKARESIDDAGFLFTTMHLKNSLTTSIDYRVLISGL